MSAPPLERWSEDGAERAVAGLARDLPHLDADDALRRLERLTPEQQRVAGQALSQTFVAIRVPPEHGAPLPT